MNVRRTALIGGAITVLAVRAALAGMITQPTGTPFVVPGDAAGDPLPFTITVAGFPPGSLVYVEQCDGTPPTAQGWSPTANCDLGSSPAAAIVLASGGATFDMNDRNHAFHPFKGPSPQGLFNCLSPTDPSPHNGLPDFRNCQVRVSSNNSAVTADQAFLHIQLPNAVATTTTTTTLHPATTTAPLPHPTTTSTTLRPCSSGGVAGALCALNEIALEELCAPPLTGGLLNFIATKLGNAQGLLEAAQTKTKPRAIARLEGVAAGDLNQILHRVARAAKRKKISAACAQEIAGRFGPLHERILGLRT